MPVKRLLVPASRFTAHVWIIFAFIFTSLCNVITMMPMTLYTVALKDIQITMPVGIRDHEYNNPQRLVIDIIMDRKLGNKHDFKTIDDCIDYSKAYAFIHEKWMDKSHTDLLENLASELLDFVMNDNTIETGTVTIHKPDIYNGAATPSVTLSRSR